MAKMKTTKKSGKLTKAKALKILGVSKSSTLTEMENACIAKVSSARVRMDSENPKERRKSFEDFLETAAAWHLLYPTMKLPEQEPGTFIKVDGDSKKKIVGGLRYDGPKPEYVEKKDFENFQEELHSYILNIEKGNLSFSSEVSGRLNLLLKEINKQHTLVRKVTTNSPNGTTTVEETFSSNG